MVGTIYKFKEQDDRDFIRIGIVSFLWDGKKFTTTKTFDLQHPLLRCNLNKLVMYACITSTKIKIYI